MKTFEEIETILTDLKKANAKEIENYEIKIQKSQIKLDKANAELAKAEDEVNVEVYNKAKDDIWAAKHAIELYTKKKNELKSTPLLSNKEYYDLTNEIIEVAKQNNESQLNEATDLLRYFIEFASKADNSYKKGNELLKSLQRGVQRLDIKLDNHIITTQKDGSTLMTRLPELKEENILSNFLHNNILGTELGGRAGYKLEPEKVHRTF